MVKNMDPTFVYVVSAILFAAMVWASPIIFLRDSTLGKVVMVVFIIALTLYHRIAGIIGLIVIIAIMQNMQVMEGLSFPVMPTTSSSSNTWNSPDEFKQKFCIRGSVDVSPYMVYALSADSKVVEYDSTGKAIKLGEGYERIDMDTVNACGEYKNPETGANEPSGVRNLCSPDCKWKMKTVGLPK